MHLAYAKRTALLGVLFLQLHSNQCVESSHGSCDCKDGDQTQQQQQTSWVTETEVSALALLEFRPRELWLAPQASEINNRTISADDAVAPNAMGHMAPMEEANKEYNGEVRLLPTTAPAAASSYGAMGETQRKASARSLLYMRARVDEGGVAGTLAVIITGTADRLILGSKLQRIIEPAVNQGWAVDLYLSVVRHGAASNTSWQPVTGMAENMESKNFTSKEQLETAVRRAGGRFVFDHPDSNAEEVDSSMPVETPMRFTQYPVNSSQIGKNVLRRFQTLEFLMGLAATTERSTGTNYDFVLVTRDDDFWLGPLNLTEFKAEGNSSFKIFSKDCKAWSGINDKTLLFGRDAAENVLLRLYSDFWMKNDELEWSYNAEGFLQSFVKLKGIISVPVPFARLPTCDSIFVRNADGTAGLCQKGFYLCDGLPEGSPFDKPDVCPFS